MTDGVWWFYLFWAPAYLKSVYGMSSTESSLHFCVVFNRNDFHCGGYLPTYFVDKKNGTLRRTHESYAYLRIFPLLALFAQPLGHISV